MFSFHISKKDECKLNSPIYFLAWQVKEPFGSTPKGLNLLELLFMPCGRILNEQTDSASSLVDGIGRFVHQESNGVYREISQQIACQLVIRFIGQNYFGAQMLHHIVLVFIHPFFQIDSVYRPRDSASSNR